MADLLAAPRSGRPKDTAKREAIVTAARTLFARQPYDLVTMEAFHYTTNGDGRGKITGEIPASIAQQAKEVFFGLGSVESPVRASIRWPSGMKQQFEALPAGHRIEIEEGSSAFVAKPFAAPLRAQAQAGVRT